mgnify:CR=1 FL=1
MEFREIMEIPQIFLMIIGLIIILPPIFLVGAIKFLRE